LGALLALAAPAGLYATTMLFTAPAAFLFDVRFTLARLNAIPLHQQWATLLDNVGVLLTQDLWLAASVVGLWQLKPALRNLSLLLLLVPILVLGRAVALYSLSAYYQIPLWPLVAIGVGGLIVRWRKWSVLLVIPFMLSVPATLRQLHTGFVTPIDAFLIHSADARAAAHFVNAHSTADDVIIASPVIATLLTARAADFQMAVAATGQATEHLPAHLPAERFAFDPRFENARYVIVDNLWRNWAVVHMPAVAAMMKTAEQWPVVFQVGEIIVYFNPHLTR
jgi:hypothetical protein